MWGHSGKNISRRMRRKMAGDMCRRLRRNLSGATNSSFYTPRRSRGSTTPAVSRMQGDPAGSCASGERLWRAKKYSWEGKSLDAMKN